MNTETQNLVARHAQLTSIFKRLSAAGQKIPSIAINELHRIESKAQASLTPYELQAAQQASVTMQAQFHRQFDIQAATQDANKRVEAVDRLAKSMTGLDGGQLQAAKNGQKYMVAAEGPSVKMMEKGIEKVTTHIGKPMTRAQWDKATSRYESIKLNRSEEAAKAHLKKVYGDNAKNAGDAMDAYLESGAGITAELLARRGGGSGDHNEIVTPDEKTIRKAQIADHWVESAKTDDNARQALIDQGDGDEFISEDYLESDEIHGDIARAFVEEEERESA